MRIVVDVTPLSHPRTGVGNYLRGSLRGLAEAAAGEHEIVAFAPVSMLARKRLEEAIDGIAVDRRLVTLPPSAHLWRTLWSRLGTPPVERLTGPLDVFHFSDWMYPRQRSGLRSTIIHDLVPLHFPGVGSPADAPPEPREVPPCRGDLRPDRDHLGIHGGRHIRAVGLPA